MMNPAMAFVLGAACESMVRYLHAIQDQVRKDPVLAQLESEAKKIGDWFFAVSVALDNLVLLFPPIKSTAEDLRTRIGPIWEGLGKTPKSGVDVVRKSIDGLVEIGDRLAAKVKAEMEKSK